MIVERIDVFKFKIFISQTDLVVLSFVAKDMNITIEAVLAYMLALSIDKTKSYIDEKD